MAHHFNFLCESIVNYVAFYKKEDIMRAIQMHIRLYIQRVET